jgi:hypothetical protein
MYLKKKELHLQLSLITIPYSFFEGEKDYFQFYQYVLE